MTSNAPYLLVVLALLSGCRTSGAERDAPTAETRLAEAASTDPDSRAEQGVGVSFGPWEDPDELPAGALHRVGSRKFAAATLGAIANDRRLLLHEESSGLVLRLVRAADGRRRLSLTSGESVRFTNTGDAVWLDRGKLWRLPAGDDAQPTFVDVDVCQGTKSAFSADGRWLVCAGPNDAEVRFTLIDVEKGTVARQWNGEVGHEVIVSSTGIVATYVQGGFFEVWRADGTWRRSASVAGLHFDDVGRLLVDTNVAVEVLDPVSQKRVAHLRFSESNAVHGVVPGPDGTFFGFTRKPDPDGVGNGNVDAIVQLNPAGKTIRRWAFHSHVNVLTMSPDRGSLLVASSGGAVLVVDLETGSEIARSPTPHDFPIDWRLSPSGRLMATYDRKAVILRETHTGLEVARFRVPGTVSKGLIEFSPDGKLLAAANTYGDVIMFDVASKRIACSREDVPLHMMRWGEERLLTRRLHYRAEDLDEDGEEQELLILDRACETAANYHLGEFVALLPSPEGEALMIDVVEAEKPEDVRYNVVRVEIDTARFNVLEENASIDPNAGLVPGVGSVSRDGLITADVDFRHDAPSILQCSLGEKVLSQYELPDGVSQVTIVDSGELMAVRNGRTLLIYPCGKTRLKDAVD